jgi:DNA phosphorothioation-dependent restriction protein DptG
MKEKGAGGWVAVRRLMSDQKVREDYFTSLLVSAKESVPTKASPQYFDWLATPVVPVIV